MSDFDLTRIIDSLSEIPLTTKDKDVALKKLAMLGRQALNSHSCTLSLVDVRTHYLTILGCDSIDPEFEKHSLNRKVKMGDYANGDYVDYELMVSGQEVEKYNLMNDGQGVANPQTARRFNLHSLLSSPLKSEHGQILYFNHFTSDSRKFTDREKTLIRILGRLALLTVEYVENLHLQKTSLRIINDLSENLLSLPPSDFLNKVSEKAAELFSVPTCIVWKLDGVHSKLKVVATYGEVDQEYKRLELSLDDPGIKQHLKSRQVGSLIDVTKGHRMFKHPNQAKRHGWVSMLSAPMWAEDTLVGMLNIFTDRPRSFKQWEQDIFGVFANQAALSIQKANFLGESETLDEIRDSINKVTSGDRDTVEGELKKISKVIVEKCAEVMSATTSQLWLLDKVTSQTRLQASYERGGIDGVGDMSEELEVGERIARLVVTDKVTYIGNEYIAGAPLTFLCVPIRSDDVIIGALGVGANGENQFGSGQRKLIDRIASEISTSLERAILADSLRRLAEAPIQLQSQSELVRQIVESTRNVMWESVCLVWLLDKDRNGFVAEAIISPEGQKLDSAEFFISNRTVHLDEFFQMTEPLYFEDAATEKFHPYAKRVGELGWKSMLAMPLVYDDGVKSRRIGILEVYSYKEKRNFTGWHRKLFETLAVQACIAIVSRRRRTRSEELNETLQKMENERQVGKLLSSILHDSLKIVGSSRGWISRLDLTTETLDITTHRGMPKGARSLKFGEGVTGLALKNEEAILIDDVRNEQWRHQYKQFWPDTLSELAVPMVIGNARVRIGLKQQQMTKPVGVINVESPTAAAFSDIHRSNLLVLARQAAIIIDRLELDQKLSRLSAIQKDIAGERDWDRILKVLPNAITNILGYDYVNISLVDQDNNRIHTVDVRGIPQNDVEDFKRMADHPLDSNDIQADIVRHKRIEVPSDDDERFDRKVWDRFGHQGLIRVFMPMMIPPDNRVIGTVEAGYRKAYRKYIYEQDIQILKNFVDFAILSLEPRIRERLELISHEISTTVGGVRSNVSFLQHRFEQLGSSYVAIKLQDLMLDCDVLMQQIERLDETFGQPFAVSRKEETNVFRDVIIKIVNQLKPIVQVNKLDWSKIELINVDRHRIVLYLDKAKLNQVVSNILTNSIKYSEPDPMSFKIKLIVDEMPGEFIIKFQDWGIGVQQGFESKIFEESFRTPEAIRRTVKGSGLGLSIALKTIRDIGGDLRLTHNSKPTEFQLVLPKSLMPKKVRRSK
jgi:GAF domain-containing protein/signal transduction histidine kinase